MAAPEMCGDGHNLRIYCSTCNRLYCGDCCTDIHFLKEGFKDHDVKPIKNCLTIEAQKQEHLIEELKQLSENAEAAALQKDSIAEESRESLSRFIAEIERLLMSAQQTRDTQCLHRLGRECTALLQQAVSVRRNVDPEARPKEALVSLLSLNSTLEKQRDNIRKSLENAAAAGGQESNFVEAVYRAVIALKGQESLEGKLYAVRHILVTFRHSQF